MIKTLMKVVIVIGVISLAWTAYRWDAITGQWKFEELCKKEGGSRFYAQVEKDVGWEVEISENNQYAYKEPFDFGHVSFVRFKDQDGILRDVYLKVGETRWMKGYDIRPADLNNEVRYKLKYDQGHIDNDSRITRTRYTIWDLRLGRIAATKTGFDYEWRSPDKSFLNAPTSVGCTNGASKNKLFKYGIFEKQGK
jgi:hypothetical protein